MAKNMGSYTVTALRDVTIWAAVKGEKLEVIDEGIHFMRPCATEQWLELAAGESREGLGMVLGVSPEDAPDATPIRPSGKPQMVLLAHNQADLPREFLGLLRIEYRE